MHIAIIGGGFTGLSAAYELVKQGHQVTVFEKEKTLGGLAHGFKNKGWNWHLESAYHHLFTNDTAILHLINELGLSSKLILTRPVTANYVPSFVIPAYAGIQSKMKTLDSRFHGNDIINSKPGFDSPEGAHTIPFDSPIHLLTYPGLSWLDKLRTGALVALMKLNTFWRPLESITAKKLFTAIGGSTSWRLLWEPLMIGKFGTYSDSICASWLWARIKKRTQKLYYIEGGFHTLVMALEKAIKHHSGIIFTSTAVNSINKATSGKYQVVWDKQKKEFDRLLLTTPTAIASQLLLNNPSLATNYQLLTTYFTALRAIPHLHAQTLILETKEPILKDAYWLNVMDRSFPFLAVVAHTNMVDKKYYGGHHLTYFGNYLAPGHPYLSMSKHQLLKVFIPYIRRLNPSFLTSSVIRHTSFLAPFAQPVHELHYSRRAPKLETPIPGIYLANMDSIYPWDRGTNYAVELGLKAAKALLD
ncbi:MAG: FAD-dependent oxidoreductase [Patescibacteria group bacterium]